MRFVLLLCVLSTFLALPARAEIQCRGEVGVDLTIERSFRADRSTIRISNATAGEEVILIGISSEPIRGIGTRTGFFREVGAADGRGRVVFELPRPIRGTSSWLVYETRTGRSGLGGLDEVRSLAGWWVDHPQEFDGPLMTLGAFPTAGVDLFVASDSAYWFDRFRDDSTSDVDTRPRHLEVPLAALGAEPLLNSGLARGHIFAFDHESLWLYHACVAPGVVQ